MTRLDARDPRARVVTAPAGSGKTTLLLYHYLLQLKDSPAERIVAITFTRKAAAELTGRLATVLRALLDPAAHGEQGAKAAALYGGIGLTPEQLRAALVELPSAPVSTVDAFALSLVQQFALHAHFALSDGSKVLLDGPVEGGADAAAAYEAAARANLEQLSREARLLLEEMTFSEAIGEVAELARAGAPKSPPAAALLDALGKSLAPRIAKAATIFQSEDPKPEASWAKPAAEWIRNPRGRPPTALLPWLAHAKAEEIVGARAEATAEALAALGLPTASELDWKKPKLRLHLADWSDDAALEKADQVRAALERLARSTRDEALTALARGAALGYDEVLTAATALCREPPPELADRYDALMVDELQDTNPAQLEFYEAFAAMRSSRPLRTFFVGDARQSIYRFRRADPHGWRTLVEKAEQEGTCAELTVNYRSSKLLVRAQAGLFGTLESQGAAGVDSLERLEPAERAEEGLIDDAHRVPVLVVDAPGARQAEVEAQVLARFADRLRHRWRAHPDETAAVLVSTWKKAAWAAERLREHGIGAQLTGDKALLESRPAADLRLLLRALLDSSDDISLSALLKHPSFGLSDRSLRLLREGGTFSRLLLPEPDLSALTDAERAGLPQKLEQLRQARARLGRESTAGILEWLVAELRWRPIVEAGPEGPQGTGLGPAQLEVLLELVRQQEAERVDPQAVAEALTPSGEETDLPAVNLHLARGVATVTTVFAAKGLEFDHVALLDVGHRGDDGVVCRNAPNSVFRLMRRRDRALLGVCLDPRGGLQRVPDPIAVLGGEVGTQEAAEEGLRLFYVGLTRAAKSVVLGLGRESAVAALRRAIKAGALGDAGVILEPDPALVRSATPTPRGMTRRSRPFEARWAEARGLALARPSSQSDLGPAPKELVAQFVSRAKVIEGAKAPPLPEVPGLEEVPEVVWGEVVHGWLARWAFAGEPTMAQALAYLEDRWGERQGVVAEWLILLGKAVRDGLPGFGELLKHRLHFEWPLLGVEGEVLWNGRSDLVVELPGKELVVVDFKAGSRVARAGAIPEVERYAPQLEAYRSMLTGAGYKVREVGLLYVRGVSWVRAPTT